MILKHTLNGLADEPIGDGDHIYVALLNAPREKNNADASIWTNSETNFAEREGGIYVARDNAESLRQIYKAERTAIAFRMNGFLKSRVLMNVRRLCRL